jgi:hypothetical protein
MLLATAYCYTVYSTASVSATLSGHSKRPPVPPERN